MLLHSIFCSCPSSWQSSLSLLRLLWIMPNFITAVKTLIASAENAEHCSSHNWITSAYGNEENRKVAAFLFQNGIDEIKELIGYGGKETVRKARTTISSNIRKAGGDHDSYIARVEKEVIIIKKLERELGMTSLFIPTPASLPLSFGYNENGEVGYSHNLELNEATRAYIERSRAQHRFKIDNPDILMGKSLEYDCLTAAKLNSKKKLSSLTLAENGQLFKTDTFSIRDILPDTIADDSELGQLIEGLIRAIEETSAAHAVYGAGGRDRGLIPFITPDLPDGILQSNLLAVD